MKFQNHYFRFYCFLIVYFIFFQNHAFSQKEGNNWYFGQRAAVNFNSGKAAALTSSSMDALFGGSATISNSKGRLMFYTNGYYVYDSLHATLSYSLKGTSSTPQTALFVPKPDSSHIYYVFNVVGTTTDKGFYYSEINTKLRSNKGDIVSGKNNILLFSPSCGKLTAVKHANRKDYWVIIHKFNSDTICAYLITSAGVNTTPVISKTGYKVSNSNFYNQLCATKMAPSGKKICSLNGTDSSFIADFDPSNGKISNVWSFYFPTRGLEFSAKSKYLYIIEQGGINRLFQYDLSSTTKNQFLTSRKIIDSSYNGSVDLIQLAQDGKIYIPMANSSYLHVINQPDNVAEKVNPQKNYVYLNGKLSGSGLPDFIQSIFNKPSFNFKSNCSRDTVFFSISNSYDLDSANWNFGDTTKGSNNYSNKTAGVFHCYKNPGIYTARLISYHKQFIDTIYEAIEVNYKKPFLGPDKTFCNSFKATISPLGDYKSYQWNYGSAKTKSINVTSGGSYSVKVIDFDGCVSSDTVLIKNPIVLAKFSLIDSASCLNNNSINLYESSIYKNDIRKKSTWYFSDGSSVIDSIVKKSFNKIGSYSIKLVSESLIGCKDSLIQNFKIFANTIVDFTINKTVQCLNGNSFDFINKSISTDSLKYQWDLGDIQSVKKHYTNKVYSSDGNYTIRLITQSDKGCLDTISKSIQILPNPISDFSWTGNCNRQSMLFTFTGNVPSPPVTTNYKWYFPDGDSASLKDPSKLLTKPGLNKVTLTNLSSNGCKNSITKDVDILTQAKADFNTKDVCEDSLVFFNNSSKDGVTYRWKFGDGNSSKEVSPFHKYIISGVSKTFNVSLLAVVPNGCSDSITKPITVNANPNSDFLFTISGRLVSFTAVENNASKYEWTFGDGGTTNSSNNITSYHFTKFPSGKYSACLKVTNAANCFTETCKEVNITGAIDKLPNESNIKLYPNPNSGDFTIAFSNPQNHINIEVYDFLGHLIQQVSPPTSQSLCLINLNVTSGIYLLRITNGQKIFMQKITVQK